MIIVVVRQQAFTLSPAAGCEIGFTPDDGFHPLVDGLSMEVDGSEEVAVVRDGDGRLSKFLDLLEKRTQLICAVQEAVLSVQVQVNELRRQGG